MEQWKSLAFLGFNDYEVSNYGRVKNTKTGYILKGQADNYGYPTVSLYENKKRTTKLVHRLVAITFLPNPDNLPEVNHKDENKFNNHIDNLEWCTSGYNINYGNRNEKAGKAISKKRRDKEHAKPVINLDTQEVFQCAIDAAKEYNLYNGSHISACCNGKRKKAAGYRWAYYKN